MNRELLAVIEQIGREKGIESQKIVSAVEMAVQTAAKKRYGANENVQVRLDRQTGEIEVVALRKVVETVTDSKQEISLDEAKNVDSGAELGDEIGLVLETGDFGRIAAQTAKQIIFQRVREAEWEAVYKEYSGREGEMVNGIVLGQERRNYIVEVGKTEALLPVSEQAPRENYRRGDRIRALLLEVKKSAKGPQIILSRTHPNFVAELFRLEVPEVAEKIVEIRGIVREPGDRTKIAVFSKDQAVDPVGACVGVKGSRVQAVVRELRGEKIDIIAWNSDPRVFIGEALNPAAVEKVGIDEEKKTALVVVSDHQLSLAIGKNGQNVRLAAKLTGWKIDIMGESEYEKERAQERAEEIEEAIAHEHRVQAEAEAKQKARDAERAAADAAVVQEGAGEEKSDLPIDLPGIGKKLLEALTAAGFDSIEKLAGATREQLMEVPKIGEKTAEKILSAAQERLQGRPNDSGSNSGGQEPDRPSAADTDKTSDV
ncbi:MAG: transcription termination/antitermination protein NusA [Nitrospirae bacterium]|nr:transcription termination/antitermination protein NusA [Nitrospirota bacterium]